MSLDFIQYPSSETTDSMWEESSQIGSVIPPEDHCCPSPLQLNNAPLSELFDQEFDNDEEVSEYNLTPEQHFAFFSGSRNTSPTISDKISNPSAFTNSTDSGSENASSQYSFNVTSSEFDTHGLYHDGMQAFMSSGQFTDPLPHIPPLNPAGAHGTMDLHPNFLADGYSTTMQGLESVTCVNPAALAVPVTPDSKAQTAAKKPFKCPYCEFSSARKHNLKTHVETHDKEASKRFECSTCGRRFSRKHDLRRHRETIHGEQMSSPSASSRSSRRFDPRPEPQYATSGTTTVGRDERLTSSHTQAGLGDLVTRWEYASWLQGA